MYTNISGDVPVELDPRSSYRHKFEELESHTRQLERRRAELERQFVELVRERSESERAATRAMKQRFKRLKEAERQRTERNESLLRMVNKIDQQAVLLASKTDQLKMLKTHYELYLMRTYSSAQSYCTCNPPMITAPPTKLSKLPQSPSKSEFAQYLSDMTNPQTTSINAIPPPTALSNYLTTQQKLANQSPYGAATERPYSRLFDRNVPLETGVLPSCPTGAGVDMLPAHLAKSAPKGKRFEMSNEDFIRYIDSEVLKEPIPTVSVVAPSPEGKRVEPEASVAYLEDAILSEDEQQAAPIVEGLVEKMDQFSILMKDDAQLATVEKRPTESESSTALFEAQTVTSQAVMDNVTEKKNTSMEMNVSMEAEQPSAQEPGYTSNTNPAVVSEGIAYHQEAGDGEPTENNVDQFDTQLQEPYDVPKEAVVERNEVEPFRDSESNSEHLQELQDTAYKQPMAYSNEDQVYEDQLPEASGEIEPRNTRINQVLENPKEVLKLPEEQHNNQEYNAEQNQPNNEVHQPQQPIQQQRMVGSQHWTTARQAMKTKAFPGATSKAPSPDMTQPVVVQGVVEGAYDTNLEHGTMDPNDGNVDPNVVPEHYEQAEQIVAPETIETTYAEYPPDANVQGHYDPNAITEQSSADQLQTAAAQGYLDDGMGQPVEYQTGQPDDGQQAEMYQYQQADGQQVPYHEGQYGAGATAEQLQYQYAQGADPTGAAYTTQEGYQDPNQQYQYDQTGQYYDQQQQGYEGQYYSEDPQQQQEQPYYMEDGSQQQQQAQYEQQVSEQSQEQPVAPVDQYQTEQQQDGQGYYPTDGQYESTAQNPAPTGETEPIAATDGPESESSKAAVSQNNPEASTPMVQSSATSESSPPEDKQERKGTTAKQTNDQQSPKKGTEPGSDTPTISTVNDESDFDFSTQ